MFSSLFLLSATLLLSTVNLVLSNPNAPSSQSLEPSEPRGELLLNGNFTTNSANWVKLAQSPNASASFTIINSTLFIDISDPGDIDWHIQLRQDNILIQKGYNYTFRFDAKAENPRTCFVAVGQSSGNYGTYGGDDFLLTTEWQTYQFIFQMEFVTDSNARFYFNFGNISSSIYLDNISLIEWTNHSPNPTPIEPGIIIAVIVAALFMFTSIIIIVRAFKQKRKKDAEFQGIKSKDRINLVNGLYTLLVTSSSGLTLFTITNAIFKEKEAFSQLLGGLSVGMDSFIKNIQKDFLHNLAEEQYDPIERNDVSTSSIIRERFHILITASKSYRIFTFFEKTPSKFAETLFQELIRDLEKNIQIGEIIEAGIMGRLIEKVISKHYPTILLKCFTFNISKMKELEHLPDSRRPLSKDAIDAIKRAMIIKNVDRYPNGAKAQLKLWERLDYENGLEPQLAFNIQELVSILTEELKIPHTVSHEIIWKGSMHVNNLFSDSNIMGKIGSIITSSQHFDDY